MKPFKEGCLPEPKSSENLLRTRFVFPGTSEKLHADVRLGSKGEAVSRRHVCFVTEADVWLAARLRLPILISKEEQPLMQSDLALDKIDLSGTINWQ
jgi:hypothetical protein